MDKDTLVSEQTQAGERLISALVGEGLEIRVAFWAKPTDEGKWLLYLASPIVDDKGPTAAYRVVHGVLRKTPDLWIDPFDIRVVGLKDSLTEAALAVIEPKGQQSLYAVRNAKPYPGITWFRGDTLGGVSVDGAYIYPPSQLRTPA